jgi:hypothetical protein
MLLSTYLGEVAVNLSEGRAFKRGSADSRSGRAVAGKSSRNLGRHRGATPLLIVIITCPERRTNTRVILRTHHRLQLPHREQPHQSTVTTSPTNDVAMSTSELATSYAALILADDGVDITVLFLECMAGNHANFTRPTSSSR